MRSKKRLLKKWKIYAILDDGLFSDARELLRKFSDLLNGPVDVIQLRFKDFTKDPIYRAAEKMSDRAKRKNIPLIINDRPEIALALGASGVHLGKADIPASIAREMLGPGAIIGRTIRGPRDLAEICEKEVDYVAIGPVFSTPLKPGLRTVSRSILRELCASVRPALIAVGGISLENVSLVLSEGVKTVAFARYGITEKDTRTRMRELREIMNTETK